MIPFLQHDQTFVTTDHQELLRCAVQMMTVRMMKNAAMISAIARTVKSIADVQEVVDLIVEEAEVEEVEEVQEAVQEAVQETVQEAVRESKIINLCYI